MFTQSLIPDSQSGLKPGMKSKINDVVYVAGDCGASPVGEVSLCRGLGCRYMILMRMTTRSVRLTGSEKQT